MKNRRKAIAQLGSILIIVILGASALGIYLGYTLFNHQASAASNSISLQGFSVNAQTNTIAGIIKVDSNSQVARMTLYVNGTYIGYTIYGAMQSMMSRMMGGNYAYMYSMMYSVSRASMPMVSSYQFLQNKTYMITMMANFDDGSYCNASAIAHT
jgi:hypothetical protein